MKGLHRFLVLLAALAVIASACNGEPAGEGGGGNGNSITVVTGEPDELDPTLYRTAASSGILSSICETLYDYDMEAELIPRLASDLPEPDEEGTTVTIPLRDGIVFNDGTDFDAEAVKTSLDRHREHEDSARSGEVEIIESVEVVDDHTIQLTLAEPFGPLAATLAGPPGRIMSPTQLDELGDDFGDDPVCVGPFEFAERPDQGTVVVEHADDYYDADQVELEQITYQAIEDNAVAVNNLRADEVDVSTVSPNNLEEAEQDDGVNVLTREGYGYQGLTINLGLVDGIEDPVGEVDTPLAQDPQLREAFELALDKEAINDVVFDGMHTVGCTAVAPHGPFGEANPECPGHDPQRAEQLIAESSYDPPVEVDLMVTTDPDAQRTGELVQSMAEEVGFDVNVRVLEATTAIDELVAGDYEMFLVGFGSGPDPDTAIYRMNHSEGGSNDSGVGAGPLDDQIDQGLDHARTAFEEDERIERLREPLELILERRAIIYLYHPSHIVGVSADLANTELTPGGMPDFRDLRRGE